VPARLFAAQCQDRYRPVTHRAFDAYKLMILDEIGYLPVSCEQANSFFQIVAQRYERGSRAGLLGLTAAKH